MKRLKNYFQSKHFTKWFYLWAFFTVLTLGTIATSIVISSSSTHVTKVPTQVIEDEAHKSGQVLWVNSEGLLLDDASHRRASYLSSDVSGPLLAQFVKDKVAVTTYPTLQDALPSKTASRAQTLSLSCAGFSFLWGLTLGSRRLMKDNKKEENDRKKALAGGGPGEAVLDFETPDTTFADVAGCDEAVESLEEMADFLRKPEKYKAMGVRMPKGGVLVGSPGTGKTLLARALAGEAKVPFFVASGSEFNEIYVGNGAKKVRSLFSKIKEHDTAILFIDEIDSVARKRSGDLGGSQEADATLNQLLTEIDGFNNKADGKAIMVLAATNRYDLLDPALVRSGRLERKIEVPNPDRKGREQILKIHTRGKPLAPDVDLPLIALRTPGFSGADLATIVNEAGVAAVKTGQEFITQHLLDQAVALVAMGAPRKSALVTPHDRTVTAWHEAGHTLCAYLQPAHDDPVAVSITPRGPAGGVTWLSGSDDIFLSRAKAKAQLVTAMGGRVGEELYLDGEYTQGPSSDFQKATENAYAMVTKYGMTSVGLQTRQDSVAASTEKVTLEVEKLLEEAYHEAKTLLTKHESLLREVVKALLAKDDLSYGDLEKLAEAHGVHHERTMSSIPPPLTEETTEEEALKKEVQEVLVH